ncbi:tape measure protein [Candidatus Aalborgicola defluviihabitans]|uniref:tape measure protein n=1 Tax=Candidatus Aalborgicola defluviihabitans TaxID=3386187 RepID=UPI001D4EBD14|nr:tape measure protein [Burkholderiales bacterium]
MAKRTNSAVEETGLLFTKLADAGKKLGVSNAEALKLTETINQSIQLSGASAEASKASIVQLVQGLQSGVLRGDEFNSVMEQSPRLARALADGLSVGTGELRKMAEEGRLTSDTVIKALQNQSDTVASEFGKLPATVGRAMTNLTTAFTAYVGESDKAHGYTAKLAGVIDGLAGHLGTVATVMIHAGQALGALKLLNMAQDWLTASAAIKATAVSTELATAATVQSTAAKVQNTTATVANTAAQVTNAAAWNGVAAGLGGVGPQLGNTTAQAGAASRAFGVVTGAVGGLMRAFAPLLALDIALHFKEYGTAIGEWTAKLMGAKDRTQELVAMEKRAMEEAEANASARKKQALATKEATDRTFGLTKEGSALIVKFDELRTKGDSASSAIASIGKDFDLSNVPGIRTAASVLDKLAAEGKISATEFQAAWADALKGQDLALFGMRFKQGMDEIRKEAERTGTALESAIARGLTGKELKVFEDKAREALAAVGNEAKRLEQVVGAQLQEAIKRSGLDMAVISGGMGKAAQSAINDTEAIIAGLDRLKAQGADTALALAASIGKGIDTADSQKAIDAVRAQIEAMGKAGQLAKPAVDALLVSANEKAIALKDALDKATPGINSLAEAMKNLGIVSDQSLKNIAKTAKDSYEAMRDSGTASLRELQEGFKAYAEKAIAANGGVASAALKVEAAMVNVSIQTDRTGKAIVSSMAQGAAAIKSVEDAYHQLGPQNPRRAQEDFRGQCRRLGQGEGRLCC